MNSTPSAQHQSSGVAAVPHGFVLPFEAGEIIAEKYRIEQLIGVGGVGFVVAATHVGLDDRVALKFLKPEFAMQTEAVTRFTIEARASFKIKNEHVARVLDVATLPDGTPFMVMELLEGQDLRSVLERHRAIPIDLAVDFALQACEALAAAHACHIVHRDIKPENLFVIESAENDQIKVLDFGISKVALTQSAMPSRKTRSSALTMMAVGTPPYMSPEQVRASNTLDARADVWSLGCVLYELISGCAPFERMSLMQACAAVLEDEPLPLREACSEVPAELDAAVMRCLRKDPAERFQDAADLARALAPFGQRYAHCADRCLELLMEGLRRSEPGYRQSEPPPLRGSEPFTMRISTPPAAPAPAAPAAVAPPEPPAPRRPSLQHVPIPGAALDALASQMAETEVPSDVQPAAAPRPSPSTQLALAPQHPQRARYAAHVAARPLQSPEAVSAEAVFVEPEDIDLSFIPRAKPQANRWILLAVAALTALSATYLTVRKLDQPDGHPGAAAPSASSASESSSSARVVPAPGVNLVTPAPEPVVAPAPVAPEVQPAAATEAPPVVTPPRSRALRKPVAKAARTDDPDVGF